MASSSDRCSPKSLLVGKVLHCGDSIKIGRKSSNEVMVKSPFISGTHCKIGVTRPGPGDATSKAESSDDLRFFVSDLSSNGTWLLKDTSRAIDCDERHPVKTELGGSECKSAKKLGKKKKEFLPGDCILLLAPGHQECARYRFTVKRKGSGYILEQLPASFERNAEAEAAGAKGSRGTKVNESESIIVGKKCSMPASGDDTRKKHYGYSLSDTSIKKSSTDSLVARDPVEAPPKDPDEELLVEMERCPNCWKLFPVHELPLHCPICQDAVSKKRSLSKTPTTTPSSSSSPPSSSLREEPAVPSAVFTTRKVPSIDLSADSECLEQCPHCLDLFPLEVLISHAETCSMASPTDHESTRSNSVGRSISRASVDGGGAADEAATAVLPVTLLRDTSMEQCPYCSELLPIAELITHCAACGGKSTTLPTLATTAATEFEAMADVERDSVAAKRARYTLEPFDRSAVSYSLSSLDDTRSSLDGPTGEGGMGSASGGAAMSVVERGKLRVLPGGGAVDELEQCVHCLKEFPISKLVHHAASCSAAAKAENTILEHCQHCLNVFPLGDLVAHALNCSQRKNIGSLDTDDGVLGDEEMWGEPLERCMHCFKDFPLSKIVEHSRKCRGDMLGSRERFKNFLPSVHDLDPMSLAVLNEAQMRAVEYVMEISKKESESVYTQLRDRVVGLGYTEHDLERTLQWIRRDAPIIIHLRLDAVLKFLVKDTHYRNLFETHTGSGSLDKSARSGWEDRIFNHLYRGSAPVDRVKYGVLNIVGDPRGVSCCSGYGDSFLQLKKVRLRTTFASEDTSSSRVVLSCCEHYGNVLYRYNNSELKAILEVATRKVDFLRSDMISQYKEIQIHGPVCLSENVDCIVVNDRHSADTAMRELLDEFVTKNKCNLIWMEGADRIDYPSFTHAPAHIPSFVPPPALPAPPMFAAPPLPPVPVHTRGGRRRRKRRRHSRDWY